MWRISQPSKWPWRTSLGFLAICVGGGDTARVVLSRPKVSTRCPWPSRNGFSMRLARATVRPCGLYRLACRRWVTIALRCRYKRDWPISSISYRRGRCWMMSCMKLRAIIWATKMGRSRWLWWRAVQIRRPRCIRSLKARVSGFLTTAQSWQHWRLRLLSPSAPKHKMVPRSILSSSFQTNTRRPSRYKSTKTAKSISTSDVFDGMIFRVQQEVRTNIQKYQLE